MTARLDLVEQLEQKGEGVISPQDGLDIFGNLLGTPAAQITVMPVNWPRFFTQEISNLSFYKNFLRLAEKPFGKKSAKAPAKIVHVRHLLENAPRRDRPTLLEHHVREQIAEILGLNVSDLPQEKNFGFMTLGIDSLTSIELRNRLQRSLDCSLPITFAFDYGTLEKMTGYLAEMILGPMNEPANHESSDAVINNAQRVATGELDQLITWQDLETATEEDEDESLEAIFKELAEQIEGP